MSNQRIKFPRCSDKRVAETFVELGKQLGTQTVTVGALAFANIGGVSLKTEPTGDWKALLDQDSYLIDTMVVSFKGLTIQYARGGQLPPEQKSPIYDEIVLTWNNPNPQQDALQNSEKIAIVALINKRLNPFEPGRTAESGLMSKEQNQLLAIHNSTLEASAWGSRIATSRDMSSMVLWAAYRAIGRRSCSHRH